MIEEVRGYVFFTNFKTEFLEETALCEGKQILNRKTFIVKFVSFELEFKCFCSEAKTYLLLHTNMYIIRL